MTDSNRVFEQYLKDYPVMGVERATQKAQEALPEFIDKFESLRSERIATIDSHIEKSVNKYLASVMLLSIGSRVRLVQTSSTRMHHLASSTVKAMFEHIKDKEVPLIKEIGMPQSVFLINHEWDSLLGASSVDEGEDDCVLPSHYSAFEFTFHLRKVDTDDDDTEFGSIQVVSILACGELDEHPRLSNSSFVSIARLISKNGLDDWFLLPDEEVIVSGKTFPNHLVPRIKKLISATCVMLEAEVAVRKSIPAPDRLNKARAAKGKSPIPPYYVVNLAKRHRYEPGDANGYQGRVRLHFRRGHWARTASGKTVWRRWCLVGNPDMGWVDKVYKA